MWMSHYDRGLLCGCCLRLAPRRHRAWDCFSLPPGEKPARPASSGEARVAPGQEAIPAAAAATPTAAPLTGRCLAGAKRRGRASPGARLSGEQRPAKSAAGQSSSEHGGTAEENSNVSKDKTQDPGASESPLLSQSSPEASFAWFGVDVYGRKFRLVLEQEGVYM